MTTGDLFDYGPSFDEGILMTLPPYLVDSPYPVFVPRTDDDGNDIAGIRLPEIAVPLATYTAGGCELPPLQGTTSVTWRARRSTFVRPRPIVWPSATRDSRSRNGIRPTKSTSVK